MEERQKLYSKWNELLLKMTYLPNVIQNPLVSSTVDKAEKWVIEAGKLEREFVNLKRQTFTLLLKNKNG